MKPIADQIRKLLPFGSPKRGRVARPDEPKRRRRRVVQVDPPHGGTDARVPRQGRWRGSVAAPASRVHGRPGIAGLHPAAGRASRGRLNGFPGALAGVLGHRIGGGRRRLSDTSATGLSDAAKAGEPAYPGYDPGAGEGLRPFEPPNRRKPHVEVAEWDQRWADSSSGNDSASSRTARPDHLPFPASRLR